jgi:integrase
MKKPTLAVRSYRHSKTHPWLLDLRAFGKGRKFYRTRAEAEAERMRQQTTIERHGREAIDLAPRELSAIIHARNQLAEHCKTITDATGFYLDHLERILRCKTTVSELAAEMIEAKRADKRSADYIRDLRSRLKVFCRDFGDRRIASVTGPEIGNWLRGQKEIADQTRRNFKTIITTLFSFAIERGMLDVNPVARVKIPKPLDKAPEIFSVDSLQALLRTASEHAPDVVPMLALGAFAGLRGAEIKRLDWSEIDLRRGYIEVKASKAKTARRRLVKVQPNLAQWLAPYSTMTGRVVPPGARKKVEAVRRSAGLQHWSKNGLRHSFASYRYAATNDAALVASELGHTTTAMLFNTYRELVTPEEAERYWKIAPVADSEKLVAFSASA